MDGPTVLVHQGHKKAPDTKNDAVQGNKSIEGDKSYHRIKNAPFLLTSTYLSIIKKHK
jgi:hypothetical protein